MSVLLSTLIGSSGSSDDPREFKNWQDWYGERYGGQNNSYPDQTTPSTTRDPGNSDGGTGTGAQQRRAPGQNSAAGQAFNWVVPTGVTKIRITAVGGGGGGGYGGPGGYGGGPGGY